MNKTKQIEKSRDRIGFLSDRLKKDQRSIKTIQKKKQEKPKKCTKTVDKKLAKLDNRIQKDQSELKIMREKRDRIKKEEGKLPSEQKVIMKKIQDAQQDLLQSGRLVSDFRLLLRDLTPDFPKHKERFMTRLTQSK
jgi:chromosome segregation ATPase